MATVFQDTFTVGSDTDIDAHTPDIGTSWTMLWQTASTCKLTAIATTDRATSAGSVANSGVMYTADATYGSADYSVSCVVSAGFTGTNRGYLLARVQDQENMYALRFTTGATVTRMYKKVSGGWTAFGSFVADPSVGDTVTLTVTGTGLEFFYNGVSKGTATDSAISSAGKAGFAMGGGTELAASTDDILNTSAIDDFLVTDSTGGGGTVVKDIIGGGMIPFAR